MTPQQYIERGQCLFCGEKLIEFGRAPTYRTCRAHDWNNKHNGSWICHERETHKSVHVIIDGIQISHFIDQETIIYDVKKGQLTFIASFGGGFTFSLEPEALANKLKTIAVFS